MVSHGFTIPKAFGFEAATRLETYDGTTKEVDKYPQAISGIHRIVDLSTLNIAGTRVGAVPRPERAGDGRRDEYPRPMGEIRF